MVSRCVLGAAVIAADAGVGFAAVLVCRVAVVACDTAVVRRSAAFVRETAVGRPSAGAALAEIGPACFAETAR